MRRGLPDREAGQLGGVDWKVGCSWVEMAETGIWSLLWYEGVGGRDRGEGLEGLFGERWLEVVCWVGSAEIEIMKPGRIVVLFPAHACTGVDRCRHRDRY
jgi:hypothetical protein